MKWVIRIFLALVVLVGAFHALNTYIYKEKQGDDPKSFADGEYLGFIHALTDNNTAMDFDDGVWLTGPTALEAAIQAGLCTEETFESCLPNGYFIENKEEKNERLTIDPNALVLMFTWEMEETGEVAGREISLAEFATLINDETLHWHHLPYSIVVQNDTVTRIEEVYIP